MPFSRPLRRRTASGVSLPRCSLFCWTFTSAPIACVRVLLNHKTYTVVRQSYTRVQHSVPTMLLAIAVRLRPSALAGQIIYLVRGDKQKAYPHTRHTQHVHMMIWLCVMCGRVPGARLKLMIAHRGSRESPLLRAGEPPTATALCVRGVCVCVCVAMASLWAGGELHGGFRGIKRQALDMPCLWPNKSVFVRMHMTCACRRGWRSAASARVRESRARVL